MASTLLAIIRRLWKSKGEEKEEKKTRCSTKKSVANGSLREKRAISVARSSSVVIRNRSQTESVCFTVQRKRVHRIDGVDKSNSSRRNSYIIRHPRSSNQAPTLTPTYDRHRSSSTNTPAIIRIV